jgi:hypothetical protein
MRSLPTSASMYTCQKRPIKEQKRPTNAVIAYAYVCKYVYLYLFVYLSQVARYTGTERRRQTGPLEEGGQALVGGWRQESRACCKS